jgi:hypothetical protein
MSEWHSYTPDGREVVIRRTTAGWIVRCGRSRGHSSNLDVALAIALRDDADVVAHSRDIDYPRWVRKQAAAIEHETEEHKHRFGWQRPINLDDRDTASPTNQRRHGGEDLADVTDPRD